LVVALADPKPMKGKSEKSSDQPCSLMDLSRFSRLDQPWGASILDFVMVKERLTARQLADMIADQIGAVGWEVAIRKYHAFGWQPTVVAAPGDLIGYQRRAEEIANRLRFQFDL